MNRRTAIIATLLSWFGLEIKTAKTVERQLAVAVLDAPPQVLFNGLVFAKDVVAYDIDSALQILPNGQMYRKTTGTVTAARYMCTPSTELSEPVIVLPVQHGFIRQIASVSHNRWSGKVEFEFVDMEGHV